VIGPGARIAHNCYVGPAAQIGLAAQLGASCWIDAGAACGDMSRVGTHSILGAGVRLDAGVAVGSHCEVRRAGLLLEPLPDRTFLHPLFDRPVRIHSG
jgi:UDP-3-O-[3-hydroxymyristoyl] glucosamine N-acyltransferase